MRLGALALTALMASRLAAAATPPNAPEARAIHFLGREIPRWSRENHCFSCHNNGDAARALLAGQRKGLESAPEALSETLKWLETPQRWSKNGGEGPFSDKRLARIQFATALLAARDARAVKTVRPVIEAAEALAGDQAEDGSWPLEGDDGSAPGSPATYGQPLATHLAREFLRSADAVRYRGHIARSGRWLASRLIRTVADASVALMVLGTDPSLLPNGSRASALGVLRQGQSGDGGWGPFVASPPEVFDTSLALIGLSSSPLSPDEKRLLERGRDFLIVRQEADGGWAETTRPSGGESYAQRISTTGWAVLALIASKDALTSGRPDLKR